MTRGKYIRTEKIKKKNSDSKKGKSNGCEGKHHSEKTKNLMSLNHPDVSGDKNPNYGKPRSDEIKLKISKTKIERGLSKGTNNSMYGVHIYGKDSPHWKGGKKLSNIRAATKRRELFGFIPLNNPEIDGWVGHHLDLNYVIFIPEEVHKSIYHSVTKNINMDIINDKVYEWFIEYYLKE